MKKTFFYQNKNLIHQRLHDLRKQLGVSQKDLAAKLQIMNVNIDQQMISKIENNKRIVTDYELACFCIALNIHAADLLQGTLETVGNPVSD